MLKSNRRKNLNLNFRENFAVLITKVRFLKIITSFRKKTYGASQKSSPYLDCVKLKKKYTERMTCIKRHYCSKAGYVRF